MPVPPSIPAVALADLPPPPDQILTPPRRRRRGRVALRLTIIALVLLGLGNLSILGLTLTARAVVEPAAGPPVSGVGNLHAVDAKVMRGGNPTRDGLVQLHDAGVSTVVDLRAEVGSTVDDVFIEDLGMEVVHLPIRDGQTPSDEQMDEFTRVVADADGLVYVHCGAGVGRAGSVSARYLVQSGQASPLEAWGQNLAIGPPSLEQDLYALGIDLHGAPDVAMVAMSRFLDSPRRILHYL